MSGRGPAEPGNIRPIEGDPIDLHARLDAEHQQALSLLPEDLFDLSDMPRARARIAALYDRFPPPIVPPGMTITDSSVATLDGASIVVRTYVPASARRPSPVVLNIHGGGLVLLSVDADDRRCIATAETINVIVVSVDYRLAPENPSPRRSRTAGRRSSGFTTTLRYSRSTEPASR